MFIPEEGTSSQLGKLNYNAKGTINTASSFPIILIISYLPSLVILEFPTYVYPSGYGLPSQISVQVSPLEVLFFLSFKVSLLLLRKYEILSCIQLVSYWISSQLEELDQKSPLNRRDSGLQALMSRGTSFSRLLSLLLGLELRLKSTFQLTESPSDQLYL